MVVTASVSYSTAGRGAGALVNGTLMAPAVAS